MASRRRPRWTRRDRRAIAGLLASLVVLAILWGSIAAPFRADGDAALEAGDRATGLRVEATRRGERARLTVTGRVAEGGGGPVVVRILGRPDAAAVCPIPDVRSSGALALPAGSTRVGWTRLAGRVPGRPLTPGQAFSMTGTVALGGPGAMRLCVYLARAGSEAGVLRTVRAVVPSRAGLTPLTVVLEPAVDRIVLPALRILAVLLLVAALARAFRMAWRRLRIVRSVVEPSPLAGWTASAWDLPPLPDDVHVPDVLPWMAGDDEVAAGRAGGAGTGAGGIERAGGMERAGGIERAGGGESASTAEPGAVVGPGGSAEAPVAADPAPAAGLREDPVPAGAQRATASVLVRETAPDRDPDPHRRGRIRPDRPTAEAVAAERFIALAGAYPGVQLLNGRREPFRDRSPIDHVLVGPAGVTVVATKHWAGSAKVAEERLFVRGLDRTKAVDGVAGQVSSVRALLAGSGLGAVPVTGVLLWSRPEGSAPDGSTVLRGVPLLDASGTMLRAVDGGVLGRDGVQRVVSVLERGLPPAR